LVLLRKPCEVILFWDAVFADACDPDRELPLGGYRDLLEFFRGSVEAVDSTSLELTVAGYHGRSPGQVKGIGPYAALVEDRDRNVILLTAEPVAG